jgi:hypothetical protein
MVEASLRRRRVTLLLLLLTFLAPLLGSWLLYINLDKVHLGTTNHGEFVQTPRALLFDGLPEPLTGGKLNQDYFNSRWTLVYVGGPECAADCQQGLYDTRQVRYALGDKMDSVQRLYLVDGAPAEPQPLHASHPDLTVAEVSSAPGAPVLKEFDAVTPDAAHNGGYIYVVDPHGYLVMRYSVHADPEDLLKDLKHLFGGGDM